MDPTLSGLFFPQAQRCRHCTGGFIIVRDQLPQFGGGFVFNDISQLFDPGFALGMFCRFFYCRNKDLLSGDCGYDPDSIADALVRIGRN